MGYTILKYLDSAEYNRILFSIDRGESDLPVVTDRKLISAGSRAISPSLGMEWFLNSDYQWVPVRGFAGTKSGTGDSKDGGNEFEADPHVSEIVLLPQKLNITKGTYTQLSAKVLGDDIYDQRVKWEIVPASDKADCSISQDGLLYVGSRYSKRSIKVKATSLLDSTASSEMSIGVTTETLLGNVVGIQLSPNNATVGVGKTISLKPTVITTGVVSELLTWTISGSTKSTVNSNGVVSIASDETAMAVIVTATSMANPSVSQSTVVIIEQNGDLAPTINSVQVVPETLTTGISSRIDFKSIVDGVNKYTSEVLWAVSGNFSPRTVISNTGKLFVAEDETATSVNVTATSVLDGTKLGTSVVTIDPTIPVGQKKVVDVIIGPKTASVYRSKNTVFSADVIGINLSSQEVNWTLSNNTSPYSQIKPTGVLVVSAEEDSSYLIVTASSVEDPSVCDMVTVRVVDESGSSSGGGGGGGEPVDVEPATETVAGIMKLFQVTGSSTEGTMSQKAITDKLNMKADVTVDSSTGTLKFIK